MKKRTKTVLVFLLSIALIASSFGMNTSLAAGSYELVKDVNRYSTADDALAGVNSVGKYEAGTYNVYKEFKGVMNISKYDGPGSWINPDENTGSASSSGSGSSSTKDYPDLIEDGRTRVYRSKVEGGYVRDRASSNFNLLEYTDVGDTYKGVKQGNWIKIDYKGRDAYVWADHFYDSGESVETSTKVYKTDKSNAYVRNNPDFDEYYLFYRTSPGDTYEGTRIGNWIRIKYNGRYTYVWADHFYETGKTSKKAFDVTGVVRNGQGVNSDVIGYASAGTVVEGFDLGDWFRFTYKGQTAYTWYSNLEDYTGSYEPEVANTPKKDGPTFKLVLDPGHGAGISSNRGGLLFNEGDQNFEFSQLLMAEAKKYYNVEVTNTRKTINDDPSLQERAKMGSGADLFLSLHTNAASPNVRGTEVFVSHNSEYTKMAGRMASMISDLMSTPNRGVKYRTYDDVTYSHPVPGATDYWGVFRDNTADTKYLIEFVFHTNLTDSRAMLNNREELARKLMEEIAYTYDLEKN